MHHTLTSNLVFVEERHIGESDGSEEYLFVPTSIALWLYCEFHSHVTSEFA